MASMIESNWIVSSHVSFQSGHGGGRGVDIRVSLLNQGGGDGMSFHDGSAAVEEARTGHEQQAEATHLC